MDNILSTYGRVAEWFKASVLKTDVGATLPRVRIPPLPIVLFENVCWFITEFPRNTSQHPLKRYLSLFCSSISAQEPGSMPGKAGPHKKFLAPRNRFPLIA